MKPKLVCLPLAALVFASCDKGGNKASADDTPSGKPQLEIRADAPAGARKTTPGLRDAPAADTGSVIDQPISLPVDPSMIRPAGTAPGDSTWETLTAGEMIVKFSSSGIARIPRGVSDKIIADSTGAGSPEAQVQFITRQAAAWHHINGFRDGVSDIPEPMKMDLIERLSIKHGGSWMAMVPELDEQVAASARVMELRMNGIPGMSPDESQDLLIKALEQHGSDYKTILSIAEQRAAK